MFSYEDLLTEIDNYPEDKKFRVTLTYIIKVIEYFKNQLFFKDLCDMNEDIKVLSKKEIKECLRLIEKRCVVTKDDNNVDVCIIDVEVLSIILKYTHLVDDYMILNELESSTDKALKKLITTDNDVDVDFYIRIISISSIEEAKELAEEINRSDSNNKNRLLNLLKIKIYKGFLKVEADISSIINNM